MNTSITTGQLPKETKKTKTIREAWENDLSRIKDEIRELEKRRDIRDDDPDLMELRRKREVHELEIEGWSVVLAQQDPGRVKGYLEDHFRDVVNKIIAVASDSGSERDKTSTVSSH